MDYTQITNLLATRIIPFWDRLKDVTYGGFYGRVTYELDVIEDAVKGGIATSRLLWFYSAAYRVLGCEPLRENADHAYRFLRDHLLDREYGGIYWMADHKGESPDTRKHIYAQSFAIYGLSEYHRATGDPKALELAKAIFAVVEEKGYNPRIMAYGEEYTRNWRPKENIELSENGIIAAITMNTSLHLLEAYTNLYRAWPDGRVRARLVGLIEMFRDRIYNPEKKRFDVYFDREWRPLLDMRSYGHDIEATWLIHDAVKAAGYEDPAVMEAISDVGYAILATGTDPKGYVWNEWVAGALDKTMIWWVQAEAMVGFFNLYGLTADPAFADAVEILWDMITRCLLDKRPGGEWYWAASPDGVPSRRDIVEPWKTAYHNGRFYLVFIERMGLL